MGEITNNSEETKAENDRLNRRAALKRIAGSVAMLGGISIFARAFTSCETLYEDYSDYYSDYYSNYYNDSYYYSKKQ
ncbi:MAG: hypothetical protein IPO21_00350 [Bacteroidales bacterium]|nr:hypothetical protein [Bacteroidales bacterium]